MRLIGQAINRSNAEAILCAINSQAAEWLEGLPSDIKDDFTLNLLEEVYPLHPIVALVLPILCTRYAQNDRSLFRAC